MFRPAGLAAIGRLIVLLMLALLVGLPAAAAAQVVRLGSAVVTVYKADESRPSGITYDVKAHLEIAAQRNGKDVGTPIPFYLGDESGNTFIWQIDLTDDATDTVIRFLNGERLARATMHVEYFTIYGDSMFTVGRSVGPLGVAEFSTMLAVCSDLNPWAAHAQLCGVQ